MQLEIEMKAWVRDPAAVGSRLRELGARHVRDYRKEDRYYRSGAQDLRIRGDGGQAIVTFKDKRLVQGLEINDEHEFTVSDPLLMAELLRRLGAEPFVEKIKTGQAWELRDLLVEVSEISGLGHFIEIERVVETGGATGPEAEAERTRLGNETRVLILELLGRLGIGAGDIESRPYTAMLLKGVTGPAAAG